MKITMIDSSSRISCDGSRLISALLKRAGHSVKNVLLAKPQTEVYTREDFAQMDQLLENSELVMVSVYTVHAHRAVAVTSYVHDKHPGVKVIWGGPHCVSAPELSLMHADGVCFAEGDIAVVDFVDRMTRGGGTSQDYLRTPNMAFRVDDENVINNVLPPFTDLDSLPHADLDLQDIFALRRGLEPLTVESLKHYWPCYPFGMPTLWILTARGCPFQCAYCNNVRYIAMHGRNPLRFRGVKSFIDELESTLNKLGFFERVAFGDDDFLSRSTAQLEEFSAEYRKRIGLPFFITSSANTYRQKKINILLDAGLRAFQLGVQSGSERILREVFNRKISIQKTQEVARKIDGYRRSHGVGLLLDFIIDTPYETSDDVIETYRYIVDAPRWARINIFLLQFFPGTPIYERAIRDGFIEPYHPLATRNYTSRLIAFQQSYETFLVLLASRLKRHGVPRFVMHALGGKLARRFASLIPWLFFVRVLQLIGLIKGDEAEIAK